MKFGDPLPVGTFQLLLETQENHGQLPYGFSSGIITALEADPVKRTAIMSEFISTLDPKTQSAGEVIEAFKQFVAGQTAAHKLVG
jgi:hypothetical protein